MPPRSFEIRTELAAPPDAVWQHVTTLEGANAELSPWFRMSVPSALRGRHLGDAPVGETLGRSWMLLFGVLPVDYDAIRIIEIAHHGFVESSEMFTQRIWHHERRVEAVGAGCAVLDRLVWTPRIPGAGVIFGWVVPALFRHRHRQLVRIFGAVGPP